MATFKKGDLVRYRYGRPGYDRNPDDCMISPPTFGVIMSSELVCLDDDDQTYEILYRVWVNNDIQEWWANETTAAINL